MNLVKLSDKKTSNNRQSFGFALPTILIVSIIMLTVLVAAVTSAVAIRTAMVSQYYNQLSQTAADAGTAYAKACLDSNDGVPLWTNVSPLKPNTDCSGAQLPGFDCLGSPVDSRCYVVSNDNVKSSFTVNKPDVDINGKASNIRSDGSVILVRNSNGAAWRTYNQSVNYETSYDGIVTNGLVMNLDATNPASYPGSGTAWTDLSGNNSNGTLTNGGVYSSGNGGAIKLDGVDDFVSIDNNPSLNVGNVLTIEAWVNPASLASRPTIYSTRAANKAGSFQLQLGNDGNNSVGVTAPGVWVAQTAINTVSTNLWQHIVYTKNGNAQKIYINGVDMNLTINNYTFIDNSDVKLIGQGTSFLDIHPLLGSIGTVRVYNRDLLASEVRQNFDATGIRYGYNKTVHALVVAGGGGGGTGGGGGGGVLYADNIPVLQQSYVVTVGASGTAGSSTVQGGNGGNSSFASLTATGGGGGGMSTSTSIVYTGTNGGSGGGAGTNYAPGDVGIGGSGVSGQGNNGGATPGLSCSPTGGGGGAGAVGANGIASSGGGGGIGRSFSIIGSLTYYGGGGGGGGYCVAGGSGGTGGGGNGTRWLVGSAGVANTGGGGGGGLTGGAGGKGVVIISYPTGSMTATGGTITNSGGYTIHKFTSSGNFIVTAGSNPRSSCLAILNAGESIGSGLYWIYPGGNGVQAYCDMANDGGGWTLVLQNNAAITTPSPNWNDSINVNNVIGTLGTNLAAFDVLVGLGYWNSIGTQVRLQVGTSPTALTNKATYDISLDASNYYALNLSNENISLGGTPPGFYASHNGKPFSTYDADHDTHAGSCASFYANHPWWYGACWNGNFFAGGGFTEAPYWTGTTVYHDYGSIWLR